MVVDKGLSGGSEQEGTGRNDHQVRQVGQTVGMDTRPFPKNATQSKLLGSPTDLFGGGVRACPFPRSRWGSPVSLAHLAALAKRIVSPLFSQPSSYAFVTNKNPLNASNDCQSSTR